MAAVILPVSGPYVGTVATTYSSTSAYGNVAATSMGMGSDTGYELSLELKGQEVAATDSYGMTMVEAINRGQNWRVRFTGMEWKSALLLCLQPFGSVVSGVLGPYLSSSASLNGAIGSKYSLASLTLLLTSTLGSPPTAPATLTALQAVLSPNSRAAFNLTSQVRELPIELCLIPYSAVISAVTYVLPFSCT